MRSDFEDSGFGASNIQALVAAWQSGAISRDAFHQHFGMVRGSFRQQSSPRSQRVGCHLNVCLKFSSYPQLAQAVQQLQVAAVLPELAAQSLDKAQMRTLSLPFLDELSREVSLVWSRRMAALRPVIGIYSGLLPAVFKLPSA